MLSDPSASLLIPAAMTLFAALAIMHVFGSLVRNETNLHDLRRRVKELQYGQAIKMAKIKGMIGDDQASESQAELDEQTHDHDLGTAVEQSDVELVEDAQDGASSDKSIAASAA